MIPAPLRGAARRARNGLRTGIWHQDVQRCVQLVAGSECHALASAQRSLETLALDLAHHQGLASSSMRLSGSSLLCLGGLLLSSTGHPQSAVMKETLVGQSEAPHDSRTFLTVTTREVVVDVVATDRHEQTIPDLEPGDFAVFEVDGNGKGGAQRITSVRYLPPLSQPAENRSAVGLHVRLGSGCAERTTSHYEVTYRVTADQIRAGLHHISIRSRRPGVQLAFGAHYYVAGTERIEDPNKEDPKANEARLVQAACFHSTAPLSLPLDVHRIETQFQDQLRYELTLPATALALASLASGNRAVQLEYAACSLDQNALPMHFMRSTEARTLSMGEYAQATIHGFSSFLELPGLDHTAAIRFVVRDKVTGNMGVALVEAPEQLKSGQLTPDEAKAEQQWKKRLASGSREFGDGFPPLGPIGSFGSPERREGAMCGDVYELASGTTHLPNFWSLDSIGSLYTYLLEVPHQQFWKTGGIPGVTRATEWFGIDYHGRFPSEASRSVRVSIGRR